VATTKKDRTDAEAHMMTLGVSSGGAADDEYGFSDDEVEEVTLQVDSVEENLEETRVVRALSYAGKLQWHSQSTETTVEFS
jgi:hypothetical protein